MISQKEIIREISKLPVPIQRELIEKVSRNLDAFVGSGYPEENKFQQELTKEERIALAKSLSGTFKPNKGNMPMTKEEDREIYYEHIMEKYR
jgi:hypothetical protein